MDISQHKEDAYSPKVRLKVKKDIDKGNKLRLKSTPTFFIGMKKHVGIISYSDLKKMVEEALNSPSKKE